MSAGYKMPKVSKSGPAGLAKVQLGQKTGKVKVSVTFKDEDGHEVTEDYVLDKENCPKWIKSGLWRVKFSGDKKKLFTAVPANEQVECQFVEFTKEQGAKDAAPKEQKGGQYGPYLQMIMVLRATDDSPYAGMEIPVFMRYNFIPLEDGGKTIAALPAYKTAKHLKILEDALYALGVLDFGPLKWSDNLLPVIEKRAKRAVEDSGKKILVTLQDGYVNAVAPVIEDLDEEDGDDWGEEEEEVKAPAKPQAKNAPVSEPDPDDDPPFEVDDAKVDYTAAEDEGDDDDIDWDAD